MTLGYLKNVGEVRYLCTCRSNTYFGVLSNATMKPKPLRESALKLFGYDENRH